MQPENGEQQTKLSMYDSDFRSAVTSPDSSHVSMCQHTEVPCHK